MLRMRDTIQVLQEAGIRDQVKVVVGGVPINREFAREIGADGYAVNAAEGVDVVKALVTADW
jgi:5-methyltetrahydrofolate--homocysteine methyltransferase